MKLPIAILLFVLGLGTGARADGFVLIRNAKAPAGTLSKADVRALYTGKTKMAGNNIVVVVVPADAAAAFDAFVDQVFGISAKTLLSKIKQEVFKGEMAKPLKAASDDDVVHGVAGATGGYGVVSPQAAKSLPPNVVIVPVGG